MTKTTAYITILLLTIKFTISFHSSVKKVKKEGHSFRPVVLTSGLYPQSSLKSWDVTHYGRKKALDALEEALDFGLLVRRRSEGAGDLIMDAMLFDGDFFGAGAVSNIRGFSRAVGVARAVMTQTLHTLLVGAEPLAKFAKDMGFNDDLLRKTSDIKSTRYISNYSDHMSLKKLDLSIVDKINTENPCIADREQNVWCFKRLNHPVVKSNESLYQTEHNELYEENVGQIVLDSYGSFAVGTFSWNGIAGRLGFSALPGFSGYANSSLGAAVAIGDQEAFLGLAPAVLAVERMSVTMKPESAALHVIRSIQAVRPLSKGAVMAMDKSGNFGASCFGLNYFPFSVAREDFGLRTYLIKCVNTDQKHKT